MFFSPFFVQTLDVEQHGITKDVPVCKLPDSNEVLYSKIFELDSEVVAHHFCLVS